MATALGIAGNALSLAELGFKICRALTKYIKDCRSADKDIKQISAQLKTTSWAVQEVGRLLGRDEALKRSDPDTVSKAGDVLEQCREAFRDIKITLQLSRKGATLTFSARTIWPLRKEKVAGLLDSLERLKSTLTLVIQLIGMTKDISRNGKKSLINGCASSHAHTDPIIGVLREQLANQIKAQAIAQARYESLLATLKDVEKTRPGPPQDTTPHGRPDLSNSRTSSYDSPGRPFPHARSDSLSPSYTPVDPSVASSPPHMHAGGYTEHRRHAHTDASLDHGDHCASVSAASNSFPLRKVSKRQPRYPKVHRNLLSERTLHHCECSYAFYPANTNNDWITILEEDMSRSDVEALMQHSRDIREPLANPIPLHKVLVEMVTVPIDVNSAEFRKLGLLGSGRHWIWYEECESRCKPRGRSVVNGRNRPLPGKGKSIKGKDAKGAGCSHVCPDADTVWLE